MNKKNYLYILFVFFAFPLLTKAKITIDSYMNAINYGDLTKEFANSLSSSYDFISITATNKTDNSFNINYTIMKNKEDLENENYNGTLYVSLKNEENILYTEEILTDREAKDKKNKFVADIFRLFPLWAIEASDRYSSEVKPLFDNQNKLNTLQNIFDRCYYSEMGLCYTTETTYNQTKYLGKVDLSEKSIDYAITKLKEKNREQKHSQNMTKLFYVFIILLILYIFCMLVKKSNNLSKK